MENRELPNVISSFVLNEKPSFFVSSQNSMLSVCNNALGLRNMDFHLTGGKVQSSRSKVINIKPRESLVSSVDEQLLQQHCGTLEATSVSVEGVLWVPGQL